MVALLTMTVVYPDQRGYTSTLPHMVRLDTLVNKLEVI